MNPKKSNQSERVDIPKSHWRSSKSSWTLSSWIILLFSADYGWFLTCVIFAGVGCSCGCRLCGPAQKMPAFRDPPCQPAFSPGEQIWEEESNTEKRHDLRTNGSCWYSNWARAGGLELPQECGKVVPPSNALFAQQLLRVGAGGPLSDLLLRLLPETGTADTDRHKPSRTWFYPSKIRVSTGLSAETQEHPVTHSLLKTQAAIMRR